MHELLNGASGERLVGDVFLAEANERFWGIGEPGFWKLERRQTFKEPWDESWVAFTQDEWNEALRLLEARRSSIEEHYRKIANHGFHTWRVRIVGKPITPYLQWELHLLRIRNQLGGSTRVLTVGQVERFEEHGPLPELVIHGAEAMYEVIYDEAGLHEGAVRFLDRELVARCQRFIQDLYEAGEDMEGFFEREVAVLEPPRGE